MISISVYGLVLSSRLTASPETGPGFIVFLSSLPPRSIITYFRAEQSCFMSLPCHYDLLPRIVGHGAPCRVLHPALNSQGSEDMR